VGATNSCYASHALLYPHGGTLETRYRRRTTIVRLFLGLVFANYAAADIVAIDGSQTSTSNCGSGPSGVVCLGGTSPFLLSQVLDGATPLVIGANDTPSFLVKNDLGSLTSLTLVFTGSLASNANIQCQVSGWSASQTPFAQNTCTVDGLVGTGPNGLTTPQTIVWSEGAGDVGLSNGELFDVRTASFAHAGQDFGQLSGVPEPAGVSLIALIVVCAAVLLRRKITRAV
jgi:hypothetical protein